MDIKSNTIPNTKRRLIPASKWDKFHPWPSIPGLRHLIFNAESNGFETCVRRIGRRVLIDEAAFFLWVDDLAGNIPEN